MRRQTIEKDIYLKDMSEQSVKDLLAFLDCESLINEKFLCYYQSFLKNNRVILLVVDGAISIGIGDQIIKHVDGYYFLSIPGTYYSEYNICPFRKFLPIISLINH